MKNAPVQTLRAARDRIDVLSDEAERRQFDLAFVRARIRSRVDRAVRRKGALFGMFIGGLVFGMLPTPPLRRIRKGVDRLPGGLMSIAVIALRMQSAFHRVASAARATASFPDDSEEGSARPGTLPRTGY